MRKILLVLFIFVSLPLYSFSPWVDVEMGVVHSGYNDIRIPGNTGTEFSFSENLEVPRHFFYRLRVGASFNKHHVFLLYAPLLLRAEGKINKNIVFQDHTFTANTDIKGEYKFNSYRLTYRYDLIKNQKITFALGLSTKIRDAKISLEGGGVYKEKTNVGSVPVLIHLYFNWVFAKPFSFIIEGEGLAAPQGRAEDFFIGFTYTHWPRITFRLGYRFLEGGADNDTVYNFTLIHYIAAGFTLKF